MAHLVFEMLLDLRPDQRRRPVHIVANDTLVESPLVMAHVRSVLGEMGRAANAWNLPLTTVITSPAPDQTFWVNLIGRGYPSPNRNFRWCTDRLKIRPTSQYIRDRVAISGEAVLLLGVRRSESAVRRQNARRYDNGARLNRHNDLPGCWVYRPILELSTEDVWEFLGSVEPPWGGTHRRLIQLYRDAGGGECPVVMTTEDAPSCGTRSSRFGCWTCTVVEKDRSLTGFVDAGFTRFEPLLRFRDWLLEIRNQPDRRMARRRDGRFMVAANGALVPGPFTLQTRLEILERLLALQSELRERLISTEEIALIRRIWAEDALAESAEGRSTVVLQR